MAGNIPAHPSAPMFLSSCQRRMVPHSAAGRTMQAFPQNQQTKSNINQAISFASVKFVKHWSYCSILQLRCFYEFLQRGL